jgi:hypothetical protein
MSYIGARVFFLNLSLCLTEALSCRVVICDMTNENNKRKRLSVDLDAYPDIKEMLAMAKAAGYSETELTIESLRKFGPSVIEEIFNRASALRGKFGVPPKVNSSAKPTGKPSPKIGGIASGPAPAAPIVGLNDMPQKKPSR